MKLIPAVIFLLIILGNFALLPAQSNSTHDFLNEVKTHEKSLNDGLVAYWDFNEGSGNILHDKSGNGNDGTIYGAKWVRGVKGYALSFNGVDDYVEVNDSASLNSNQITVVAWVYPTSRPTSWGPIVSKWDGDGYSIVQEKDTYYPHFGFRGSDGLNYHAGWNGTLDINRWYNLVGVFNGVQVRFYINGVLKSSVDVPAGVVIKSSNDPLRIGADGRPTPTYFSPSVIDEVRIYNRALSGDEIKELYYEIPHPPSSPQNLQASAGDEYVSLSWSPPLDDGGSKIKEYRIYVDYGNGWEYVGETSETNYKLSLSTLKPTLLGEETKIKIKIVPVNGMGEGSPLIQEIYVKTPVDYPVWAGIFAVIIVIDLALFLWKRKKDEEKAIAMIEDLLERMREGKGEGKGKR